MGKVLQGRLGQVQGPFDTGVNLLSSEGAIGAQTPETTPPVLYKLGIQATEGTVVKINGIEIKIGKTGIYELDNVVNVKSLIFESETDSSTIVDYVY